MRPSVRRRSRLRTERIPRVKAPGPYAGPGPASVPELDAFIDGVQPRRQSRGARRRKAKHEGFAFETLAATWNARVEAPADEDANETGVSLDNLDSDSPATPARDVEQVYDLPPS